MDGSTVIFPDAYIDDDGTEKNLGIDYNGYIIEIDVDFKLIRLTRYQLAGLIKMMEEFDKV